MIHLKRFWRGLTGFGLFVLLLVAVAAAIVGVVVGVSLLLPDWATVVALLGPLFIGLIYLEGMEE